MFIPLRRCDKKALMFIEWKRVRRRIMEKVKVKVKGKGKDKDKDYYLYRDGWRCARRGYRTGSGTGIGIGIGKRGGHRLGGQAGCPDRRLPCPPSAPIGQRSPVRRGRSCGMPGSAGGQAWRWLAGCRNRKWKRKRKRKREDWQG